MSFNYDENLADNVSIVRWLVGQHLSTSKLLQDEEITKLLVDHADNVYMAASECCVALAAHYAKDTNIVTPSGANSSNVTAFAQYMKLSKSLAERAATFTGTGSNDFVSVLKQDITDRLNDPTIEPSRFHSGQFSISSTRPRHMG